MNDSQAPRTARRQPARRGGGAALRAEIIQAASEELARTGDAATLSLSGVARSVGIATTSIYLHFKTLDDLRAAVKQVRFEELNTLLREAAEAAGSDPLARILARTNAYLRFCDDHPGEYAVMFAVRLEPATEPPQALRLGGAFDGLAADIAAAWKSDPTTVKPEAVWCAIHIWTSMHGALTLRLLRAHMAWPDIETEITDLVTRLVAGGPRPAPPS